MFVISPSGSVILWEFLWVYKCLVDGVLRLSSESSCSHQPGNHRVISSPEWRSCKSAGPHRGIVFGGKTGNGQTLTAFWVIAENKRESKVWEYKSKREEKGIQPEQTVNDNVNHASLSKDRQADVKADTWSKSYNNEFATDQRLGELRMVAFK